MLDPPEVNQFVAICNSLEALLNLGVACASRFFPHVVLEHLKKLGVAGIQFPYGEHSLLHLIQIPKSIIPILFYPKILALCSELR